MEIYFATYIIDIAALFFLIGLIFSNTSINIKRKEPFFTVALLTLIIILSEAGTILAGIDNFNIRSFNIVFNVLGFALSPIIPVIITLIFNKDILGIRKIFLIPTLLNIVFSALSPFTGFVFYINDKNQYQRGMFFIVFIGVYCFNFLYLIISTLEIGRRYNYPIMKKTLALSVFTIIGTSIQLIKPLAFSSWHCVTLSLLLYFLLMSEFDNSFDTITGLYNRCAFDKRAKESVKTKAFSIIILDIDDFKIVNDTYGHSYGDKVLKVVASTLLESFKKHYTCYRFGGDEFAIISSETNKDEIEHQLKKMEKALKKASNDKMIIPTVSYGYSIYPKGEDLDFNHILEEADQKMYQFKKTQKSNMN